MENKDNQVIITGIHVYDIKWKTDKEILAALPVEVDLPYRQIKYRRDPKASIEVAIGCLYGGEPLDYHWEFKYQTTDEERKGLNKDGFFVVTRIHRDDLNNIGFDGENISDEDMEELANRMNDDYLGQLYWESMEIIAESMGIPRKEEK